MKYLEKLNTEFLSRTQKALLYNVDPFAKKSKLVIFFNFVWVFLAACAVYVAYTILDKR